MILKKFFLLETMLCVDILNAIKSIKKKLHSKVITINILSSAVHVCVHACVCYGIMCPSSFFFSF